MYQDMAEFIQEQIGEKEIEMEDVHKREGPEEKEFIIDTCNTKNNTNKKS